MSPLAGRAGGNFRRQRMPVLPKLIQGTLFD